jgi:hypothetical protein
MHLPPLVRVLALLGFVVGSKLLSAEPVPRDATSPVIWRVDHANSVGGQATTVWGAPSPISAPGGGALQFNGATDGLLVPDNPLAGRAAFTLEILFRPDADGSEAQRFLHVQDAAGARALLEIRVDGHGLWWLDTFLRTKGPGLPLIDPKQTHATGQWYWAALRYDGHTMSDYVNGRKEMEGLVDFAPMGAGQISLGVRQNKVFWFKGAIAEVRFHPTAIAPDELQRVKE